MASYYVEESTGKNMRDRPTHYNECHRLHEAYQNARSQFEASLRNNTTKFIPINSLKVSPYVDELLRKFQKENKELKEQVDFNNNLDINGLEIEVPFFFFFFFF